MFGACCLAALSACSGRPDPSSQSLEQPARTSPTLPASPGSAGLAESYAIRYAALTEASAAGANETYFSIIEDESLFILADATRPPGDASKRVPADASRLAAEAMSPDKPDTCPPSNVAADEARLTCALERAHAKLLTVGAGETSIAAVAVRGRQALVGSSGDVSVLWIHGGRIEVVAPTANRRPIGTSATPQFDVRRIDLNASDTIAIVSRGLVEAVGLDRIKGVVPAGPMETTKLKETIASLVGEGKQARGHGALTAVFVHLVLGRA